MDYDPANVSVEEIEKALPKLSRKQIVELDRKLHDYLETSLITRAAETAFSEWEDPEEDIYSDDV